MKLSNQKKFIIFLTLIVFISIGFAYLSTNLSINGLGMFKPNTWDVHFANIVDDGAEVELTVPAKISTDGHSVDFDVDLNNVGDSYYFYVDIVNNGTIDAMIDTWELDGITPENEKFIKVSITYADGVELGQYNLLSKKKSDKLKVFVQYTDDGIDSIEELPKTDGSLTVTLDINYIQADERAKAREHRSDVESPVVRVNKSSASSQGNNSWYKNLVLTTKLIDPSGINSAKYCATTNDSCTPDNPVELKNNTFDIRLDNSKTPWTVCVETTDSVENKDTYCDKNKYYVDGEDPIINKVTANSLDDTLSITVEANDAHSGVSKYYFSKDGGTSYVSSRDNNYTFAGLEPDDYIVMNYVEDNAGNTSSTNTTTSTVRIRSWCEKNGITNLSDCAIATAAKNPDVSEAKKDIEAKGKPDFSKTSPTYTYKEKHSSGLNTTSTTNSTIAYSTEYTFDPNTGKYTLKNPIVGDIESIPLGTGNYYSFLSSATSNFTLYKLESFTKNNSSTGNTYIVSKYNYTYDVDSYDDRSIGMYSDTDDSGITYYYRGSVGGNFVKFANMYWRIIRINGDGSVRLMYFSDTDTTKGKNAFTAKINENDYDNTYVGLMYNDDFSKTELISDVITFSNIRENTNYFYSKNYSWDSSTKRFKLTGSVEDGNVISGKWKDIHEQVISGNYVYSCFGTSLSGTCPILKKITEYYDSIHVKVQYISYTSTSYENSIKNIKKSTMLNELEKWYKTNIENQRDTDGNLYSDLIENSVFCNDKTLSKQGGNGNGFKFYPQTYYGAYFRLVNNKKPSYQCPSIDRDGFTLKGSSIGNQLLDYPVGIITIDEIAYAGGVNGLNNSLYFMNYNDNTWTMSPSYFNSGEAAALNWRVLSTGSLDRSWVTDPEGIRPVISLSKDVLVSGGDGTADNPYTVSLNN